MRLQLKPNPICEPVSDCKIMERVTLLRLIETSNDIVWAKENLHVTVNGAAMPACWWPYVTVKPEAEGMVVMTIIQGNGKVLPIIASVALIALTAGIGTFGVPFLGAGFAAGSFGASAIAAGVGLGGQLALNALTSPPSVRQQQAKDQIAQAGISVNQLRPLELLETIHGEVVRSPSIISPSYVTFTGGVKTIHAIVGCEGRNEVTEIKVNGVDIDEIDDLVYEVREGAAGDAVLTKAQLTCIQDKTNVIMKNFETLPETGKNVELKEQVGDGSLPTWKQYKTKGDADEIWIKHIMPSGAVRISSGNRAAVPIRTEIRLVGDPDWIALPVYHVFDDNLASGPVEWESKIKFVDSIPAGRVVGLAVSEYPVYLVTAVTNDGTAFQYDADSYFAGASSLGILPDMTSGSQAGYIITASAGANPWRVADRDGDTTWVPGNNQLPAWVKFQLPAPDTVRSYRIRPDTNGDPSAAMQTNGPTAWFWEWSDDDVAWTLDHTVDNGLDPPVYFDGNMGNPGDHIYWRVTFTANNGAASDALQVAEITLFSDYASGTSITDVHGFPGATFQAGVFTKHAHLTEDGVEFYLLKSNFPKGVYEFRTKRGLAYQEASLNENTYIYDGSSVTGNFFEDVTLSGKRVVRIGQKSYRSDTYIERVSTVSYDVPVDTSGITCIAIEAKGLEIESISAKFKSYARCYDETLGVWKDAEEPTNNPAALYRRLKLGHAHPNPPPTELINDEVFTSWYLRCVAAGHECNYVQQGTTIADVQEVISYCGYASPQEAEMIGVIEDYDRSPTGTDEQVSQTLSPLNCRLLGEVIPFPDIEDAIIAEFFDEDDDYKVARPIIYRDGYNAINAKVFITIKYHGFTNLAKVTARARFDMLQSILRAATVQVEVDVEGLTFVRGQLVGHNDDVIEQHNYYGLITAITQDGFGNVISIEVNNDIPFSAVVNDLDVMLEGIDPLNPVGVAIRKANGTSLVKTLSTVTDGRVATFTTPFPLAGSGVALKQLAVFGVAGKEFRRMIVMGSTPKGNDKRVLSLAPEAPELFA